MKRYRAPSKFLPKSVTTYITSNVSVDSDKVLTLEKLFNHNPTVKASYSVLHSQLFSNGIELQNNGKVIGTGTEDFDRHINNDWVKFASDVLRHYLVVGFCAVSFKESTPVGSAFGTKQRGPMVPFVIPLDRYELLMEPGDEFHYTVRYKVRPVQGVGAAQMEDDKSLVFIYNDPTSSGDPVSPLATVSDMVDMVRQLSDYAVVAESLRSRPAIVTERAKRPDAPGIQSSDMFMDSESQDLHAEQQKAQNLAAVLALKLQSMECARYNSKSALPHLPPQDPDVGSRILALPLDQQVANTQQANARTDLVELIKTTNEAVCSAMGIPASLVFESRFAGRTGAQLALFNSTVQQFANAINRVLTECYIHIYDHVVPRSNVKQQRHARHERAPQRRAGTHSELVLATNPIAVTDEIINIYNAGLADFDIAAPLALHTVGASNESILQLLERHRKQVAAGNLEEWAAAAATMPLKDDGAKDEGSGVAGGKKTTEKGEEAEKA